MNKIRPLLMRDNRHSQIIFVAMTVIQFMIIGPIALNDKAALAGLAVLIFLTMFIILIFVMYTDKTCPRYIVFADDELRLVYWDRHEQTVKFSEIKKIEIGGAAVKMFDGIIKINTAGNVIKIKTEIFDIASTLVNLLKDKAEISYESNYIQNVIETGMKGNEFSKKMRLVIGYGFVLIFLIMAVFINLQLSSIVK